MDQAAADNPQQLAAQAVAPVVKMNSILGSAEYTAISGGRLHNSAVLTSNVGSNTQSASSHTDASAGKMNSILDSAKYTAISEGMLHNSVVVTSNVGSNTQSTSSHTDASAGKMNSILDSAKYTAISGGMFLNSAVVTSNVGSNTQSTSSHTDASAGGSMNSFLTEAKGTIIYNGSFCNNQHIAIHGASDPKQLVAQVNALKGKMNFMFNSAGVIRITGGTFVNYQNVILHGTTFDTYLQQEPLLEALHKRVALNALNAGGRADDVRCYPGTRRELIGRVNKWRAAQDNSVVPIFRLVGHVGIGKSAIMQTLSDSWKGQRVPHACFFFNRKDDTRNSPSPLIATLLYQLIPLYPPLAKDVAEVVFGDPLVFESKLEDQLARLIFAPLHKIQVESPTSYRKPTLLIDGLNECEADQKRSQHQILSAFDKVMAKDPCPFQLLVASRDEPQIQVAFETMSTMFCSFYLDNIPGAEDDIRIFVNAQFDLIKRTHPFAHTITDDEWPPAEDVDSIVRKSSGQYIYAVTVMSFIMDSSSSPEISLKHLRKPKDNAAAKSAFSQVDEVYTRILSQVTDPEALRHMLYAQFHLRKQRMLLFCKCPKDMHTDDDILCKANDPKFWSI